MVKINLGCGPSGIDGWENYDWGLMPFLGKYRINILLSKIGVLEKDYGFPWPKIKLVDIRKKIGKKDSSVDYIYCSHVLEHFEKSETLGVLKECKRVLKRNGFLRIVLPDLEIIKKIKNADNFNKAYLGIDKEMYKSFLGKLKLFFIRPHLWMYNLESFTKMLNEAGFKNVYLKKYRVGNVPDLERLDLEIHQELSFYVEASN
ncbi:MAG TPA: methyltransferase domain-containing protein [Candidatus Woesebacteria bacterium]|nr:methyltransferase domain-containing protein [Candidatus Woesebacteria bacterium]